MSKEITKAFILQEIEDKFKLRELEPERFSFSEQVIPVYDIKQHLETPEIKTKTASVTGTGALYLYTVPETERWHIHGYNVIFMTGAYTIAGIMIYRPLPADYFYLDLAPAIAASYVHILPQDVILNASEDVAVNVDGYTTTGNLMVLLNVTVETIR